MFITFYLQLQHILSTLSETNLFPRTQLFAIYSIPLLSSSFCSQILHFLFCTLLKWHFTTTLHRSSCCVITLASCLGITSHLTWVPSTCLLFSFRYFILQFPNALARPILCRYSPCLTSSLSLPPPFDLTYITFLCVIGVYSVPLSPVYYFSTTPILLLKINASYFIIYSRLECIHTIFLY